MVDHTGNLPSLPSIFPDQMAPVIRAGPDGRELVMMRWGFPTPPNVPGNRPVTNLPRVNVRKMLVQASPDSHLATSLLLRDGLISSISRQYDIDYARYTFCEFVGGSLLSSPG